MAIFRSKWLPVSFLIIFGLVAWRSYRYFFDQSYPSICLLGLQEGGHYAGEIKCTIQTSDEYKVGYLSILLDDQPLVTRFKVNKKSFEHPFSIPTQRLTDGRHLLTVVVNDASYHAHTTTEQTAFSVDNQPLHAAFVKPVSDLKVFQGRVLKVPFQVNKPIERAVISTISRSYPCTPESPQSLIYECFVPISCEEVATEYPFTIEITDHVGNKAMLDGKFLVVMYPFKQQRLSLSAELIKTENEQWPDGKVLESKLVELTAQSPARKLWQGTFYVPADSTGVSTEFGTVRTTQERGKYAHNAIDLLGKPRSVIWAPQDGIVVLAERFANGGNTVVIDHGCGILSMLFHLDSIAPLTVGEPIKKGSPVGTLGKTGYASGYHLHWEMRVHNIQVDPMQWTKVDF